MNPVRGKFKSFLIETAQNQIDALDPQALCATELSKVKDVDAVIAETAEKTSQAATLVEISKIFLLAARLKRTSAPKKEAIKNDIRKIAELLLTRVETESGPLNLPQSCRLILLGL